MDTGSHVSPFKGEQSKQRTGQEPNRNNHNRFAKDTVEKNHCVATDSKTCSKRISCHPVKVRHANYVVAKKTTKSRICYALSPDPASQSPLTSTCSRAHVQNKSRYQEGGEQGAVKYSIQSLKWKPATCAKTHKLRNSKKHFKRSPKAAKKSRPRGEVGRASLLWC